MRKPPESSIGTPAPTTSDRIFTASFINLMISNGLLRVCMFMLVALVPLYALDRGLSPGGAGLTTTLYMLAAVFVRPLAGRLVDTRGRFVVMIAGAVLFCVATGFYVFTLPLWAFLAVRVFQGIGFSLTGTAVMTLATDLLPEHRMAQGIGYLGVEATIAQIFAPWLTLELLAAQGFRVAFTVVFGFSVLNVLVRLPLAARSRRLDAQRLTLQRAAFDLAVEAAVNSPGDVAATTTVVPLWQKIVEKNAWRPAAVMFLVMVGTTGVNTFLAALAIERGIANGGLFFAVSGVGIAVSRIALGRLGRRIPLARTVVVGMLVVAASLFGVFLSTDLLVLLLSGAAYGLGMGAVSPGINTLAVLAAEQNSRGMANSTFYMAMDLGQAVSAVSLGLVAGGAGLGSIFAIGSGVVLLALVALAVLRRRGLAT